MSKSIAAYKLLLILYDLCIIQSHGALKALYYTRKLYRTQINQSLSFKLTKLTSSAKTW